MDSCARLLKSPSPTSAILTDSRRHTPQLSGVVDIYAQLHLVNLLAFAFCHSQVLILAPMQSWMDSWKKSSLNGMCERLRTTGPYPVPWFPKHQATCFCRENALCGSFALFRFGPVDVLHVSVFPENDIGQAQG